MIYSIWKGYIHGINCPRWSSEDWEVALARPLARLTHCRCPWGGHLIRFEIKDVPRLIWLEVLLKTLKGAITGVLINKGDEVICESFGNCFGVIWMVDFFKANPCRNFEMLSGLQPFPIHSTAINTFSPSRLSLKTLRRRQGRSL